MATATEHLEFYYQLKRRVESLWQELGDETLRPEVKRRKQEFIDMYLSMMEEANLEYFKGMNQLN